MVNPDSQSRWAGRLVAALLWALAAASVAFWGLSMAGPGAAKAVPQAQALVAPVDVRAQQSAVASLLGAGPLAANGSAALAGPAARFALLGVIASVAGQGAALISVDGQPARPLRVGAQIAPGYRLEAVGRREAVLADDAPVPAQTILLLPAPETSAKARTASPALAALPVFAEPAAATVPAVAQSDDAGPPPRADSRRRSPGSLQRSPAPGA